MNQITFPAMGTTVHVLAHGGDAKLIERARDHIELLERRWSRFRPDSEISRLNAHAGAPVIVSAETFDLISLACEGKRLSGGSFEPLILPQVIAAGYDRSFEQLSPTKPTCPAPIPYGRIELLAELRAVRLPEGSAFDPGGIGKGLAADMVVAMMLEHGARGALVNVGGDLCAAGEAPAARGWTVEIAHPVDRSPVARIALADGAIATSSPSRRAWMAGRAAQHHLIDPSSARPAETDIVAVTAIASQGWLAEVAAKAAFFAGDGAIEALRALGTSGLVVRTDGSITTADDFESFAA